MQRQRAQAFLIFILLVSILAGFFIFPKGLGARFLPWRLGLDLVGGSHLVYEIDMKAIQESDRASVSNGIRDVIERRVNRFGVSEPQVVTAREGASYRLIVELAGIKDISEAIKTIGETPFLFFAEVKDASSTPGSAASTSAAGVSFQPTQLTGSYVKGAQVVFDQVTGLNPQISLEFTSEGAKVFEQLTEKNIGKQIAVFLDGQVITAPVVQEKISGGRAQITGRFTLDDAKKLVQRFNAGALPAPIKLVSQQIVGASLGIDSLQRTLWAGLIASLLVVIFMLLYYGYWGSFAVVALLMYIALNLSVFKLFSITMTLSGIAGIILSIGMAVDANILIFERSKEEIKRGLSKSTATEEGFRRAWLSIRDSNITTIITSAILYYFTTGFVKGFALALLIGVLISMFSAITITRNLFRVFTKNDAKK